MIINSINPISEKDIIDFYDYLYFLPYDSTLKDDTGHFFDIWKNYIIHGKTYNQTYQNTFVEHELYPLKHIVNGYMITIYFCVDSIQTQIAKQVLSTSQVNLHEINSDLSYSDTGSKKIYENAFSTPIIAVLMPTVNDNHIKHYALIDGNHRVSAAIYLNKNIPITCIDNIILNPNCFISNFNWMLYSVLSGFYILTSGLFDRTQYLNSIKLKISDIEQ